MVPAAKTGSLAAQGIAKRLVEACGQSSAITIRTSEIEEWLFNVAASGSLIAAEDLAKIESARMQKNLERMVAITRRFLAH